MIRSWKAWTNAAEAAHVAGQAHQIDAIARPAPRSTARSCSSRGVICRVVDDGRWGSPTPGLAGRRPPGTFEITTAGSAAIQPSRMRVTRAAMLRAAARRSGSPTRGPRSGIRRRFLSPRNDPPIRQCASPEASRWASKAASLSPAPRRHHPDPHVERPPYISTSRRCPIPASARRRGGTGQEPRCDPRGGPLGEDPAGCCRSGPPPVMCARPRDQARRRARRADGAGTTGARPGAPRRPSSPSASTLSSQP